MVRYTYNPNSNACEQFVYGGCGGTANNFETEDACNNKCKHQLTVVTEEPETLTPGGKCKSISDQHTNLVH